MSLDINSKHANMTNLWADTAARWVFVIFSLIFVHVAHADTFGSVRAQVRESVRECERVCMYTEVCGRLSENQPANEKNH